MKLAILVGVALLVTINLFGHRASLQQSLDRRRSEIELPMGGRLAAEDGGSSSSSDGGQQQSPSEASQRYQLDRGIVGEAAMPAMEQLMRRSWELEQHNSEATRAADLHDAAILADATSEQQRVPPPPHSMQQPMWQQPLWRHPSPHPPPSPPSPPSPPDPGRNQSDWPVWWMAPFFDHTSFGKEAATTVLGMIRCAGFVCVRVCVEWRRGGGREKGAGEGRF